jgi:large subunit ribosomal protein L35e
MHSLLIYYVILFYFVSFSLFYHLIFIVSVISTYSKVVRKSIARVLTVINQKKRDNIRANVRSKNYKPLDIRVKRTRALRRRLSASQAAKKTLKQVKKEKYYPIRKIALRA